MRHKTPSQLAPEVGVPSTGTRAAGATAAFAAGIFIMLSLIAVLAAVGARDSTIVGVGSSFAAPLAGLLFAGWRRPAMFLAPLEHALRVLLPRFKGTLNKSLEHPAQRAIFVVAVLTALPWLAFGLVGELFDTSSFREYWRSTFYPLFNTLFEVSRWGYEPRWFDWSMLVALILFALAFSWRHTIQPLATWVLGRSKN